MPRQKKFEDFDKEARSGLSKEGKAVEKALNSAAKKAGKVASSVAKGVGNVASIAADTLNMSAKEVASGKAGQRILIKPATKAVETVYRHGKGIWDVVSEEAKKKFESLVKAGKKPIDKAKQAAKDAEYRNPKVSPLPEDSENESDKAALKDAFWGENMPQMKKKRK